MSIIMNQSLGSVEYDGLINSAYPTDIIHANLASGYGKLNRGHLIGKDSDGNLIPWGSDITDDLSEELSTMSHVATKSQEGLNFEKLKVYSADLYEETLEVSEHAVTKDIAGLDTDSLVVKSGNNILAIATDYTVAYTDNELTVSLVGTSIHYSDTELTIICFYDDVFVELEETTDYIATYVTPLLTVTFVATSEYYNASKIKVVCPYEYDEDDIAEGNLILAEDIDTGSTSGQTVVAEAYRIGTFSQNKLLFNSKALGGITDITKEKLRSLGILLNDSIS